MTPYGATVSSIGGRWDASQAIISSSKAVILVLKSAI